MSSRNRATCYGQLVADQMHLPHRLRPKPLPLKPRSHRVTHNTTGRIHPFTLKRELESPFPENEEIH